MKEKIIDWTLRVCIILSLAMSAYAYYHQENLASCTARWADNFTSISTTRATANTTRIDALNGLLVDAINAGPNSGEDPKIKADVQHFLDVEKNYKDTVRTHPLPDPPSEVCH